jgi:hypothetical protein
MRGVDKRQRAMLVVSIRSNGSRKATRDFVANCRAVGVTPRVE